MKSKYMYIKEHIISKIGSGEWKPDETIPSENELSKKFNMSRHTIRRALSDLAAEGIVIKVQGKGTYPRRLKKIIGVMMTYLDEYIFPEIIEGIGQELDNYDYEIILRYTNNTYEKEKSSLEYFLDQNMAGLLLEPSKNAYESPNLALYKKIDEKRMPSILIHGIFPGYDHSYIIEDDFKAGYIATEHLIENGHKKIACIFKNDETQGIDRYRGYTRAMDKAGLEYTKNGTIFFTTENRDDLFFKDQEKILLELTKTHTALIAYNDQLAIRVMEVLANNGVSIPEEFSVISFDDSEAAARNSIKLTSVAHPKNELGRTAARELISLIKGNKEHSKTIMEPHLVTRGSVKKIR